MITEFDKPYKTYEEQIELMRSRNVSIPANAERDAINALSTFSYYTLMNGYKHTPISKDGRFIEGTTIYTLIDIHIADRAIKSLLLKNILHIETSFKTKLAHLIARDLGVFTNYDIKRNTDPKDYLSICHYRGKDNRWSTLMGLKEVIQNAEEGSSLHHYRENKNHIPPWILAREIVFYKAINWYRLLRQNAKEEISYQMLCGNDTYIPFTKEERKEFFLNSLEMIRRYRNSVAHEGTSISYIGKVQFPKQLLFKMLSPLALSENEYQEGIGKGDLFTVMTAIILLLGNDYLIGMFLANLGEIIKEYSTMNIFAGKTIFDIFGLPENLIDRLSYVVAK